MNTFYQDARFGSARWAASAETAALRRATGLYLGLDANGVLRHPGDGPAIMVAGSGAGKGAGLLMHNALTYPGSALFADFRGEFAAVSMAAQAMLAGC